MSVPPDYTFRELARPVAIATSISIGKCRSDRRDDLRPVQIDLLVGEDDLPALAEQCGLPHGASFSLASGAFILPAEAVALRALEKAVRAAYALSPHAPVDQPDIALWLASLDSIRGAR